MDNESRYFEQQMTLREAQLLTLTVLKQVMEEKLDQHNVQLAQVCPLIHDHVMHLTLSKVTPTKGFEILDEASLKAVIEAM